VAEYDFYKDPVVHLNLLEKTWNAFEIFVVEETLTCSEYICLCLQNHESMHITLDKLDYWNHPESKHASLLQIISMEAAGKVHSGIATLTKREKNQNKILFNFEIQHKFDVYLINSYYFCGLSGYLRCLRRRHPSHLARALFFL
jgi:hypothetical protein